MNILCIKLASGEELIARTFEDIGVTDAIIAENIFSIGLQRVSQNEVAVGMTPWLTGAPGARVNINLMHVLTVYEPAKELADSYIQRTTGIALA